MGEPHGLQDTSAALSPVSAHAAARPADSCYQFGYTYNISSYEIQPEFTGGSGHTTYSFTDACG
ncbi:hypothetical protein [Actinospica robiniae]|uniref:hypothetical protein n=1 Tax=Actinospica robiniae TaxID=304901 RepID=UPI0003FEF708|nr:hypothetical protein [Actinospica robiniae]